MEFCHGNPIAINRKRFFVMQARWEPDWSLIGADWTLIGDDWS